MKSSSETEFYHNGPKPFKKVLKPVNPFFCFGSHSEKKNCVKLYYGTEIQCFNAVRAQHSDLDVAGRKTLYTPE